MRSTIGISLFLGAMGLGGCSGINLDTKNQCGSDIDCNPGRICQAGTCTYPDSNPSSHGPYADATTGPDADATTGPGAESDAMVYPQYDVIAQRDGTLPEPDVIVQEDAPVVPMADATPPTDVALPGLDAAACAVQDGPVSAFESLAEVDQAVVGRWLFCTGEPSSTMDMPIEFTADGHYFLLASDGRGGLVRQVGFGKAGTFVIDLSGLPSEFSDAGAAARDASLGPSKTIFFMHLYADGIPGSLTSNLSLSNVPQKMLFGPSTYVPFP